MSDNPSEFLLKSVTAQDMGEVMKGGVLRLIIPWGSYGYDQISLPPKPPAFWTPQRDAVLRATIYQEAMWAGAVGVAITKLASSAFEITSDVPKRQKEAQQLLLHADGEGWIPSISKGLRDFITTDNGQFIEVVRQKASMSSKIVGLRHLDSARCTRTGDIEIPVLYRDRAGRIHELRAHQVVFLADMPDPAESYFGVGMCAASRAYQAIYKLAAIEWYLAEKVSGMHPLAIHIVNGVLDTQLQNAVATAKEEQVSRGVASYMGAVIVGVPQQTSPSLVTIPLAELPDRFDRKEEFDLAVLTYANAIGIDVQDIQPLSGQGLGTGAQSGVLADKAQGKGLISWRQQFTHILNQFILDDLTEFAFLERDYRDQKQAVDLQKGRADTSKVRIEAGITTPAQELVVLVQEDDLPEEFLPADTAASVAPLSDTDQPGEVQSGTVLPAAPVAMPGAGAAAKPVAGEEAAAAPGAAAPADSADSAPVAQPVSPRVGALQQSMRAIMDRKRNAPRLAAAMLRRRRAKEISLPPSKERLEEAAAAVDAEWEAARLLIGELIGE